MTQSDSNLDDEIADLSLMLLYLTRFRERKEERWRAWKGYDFAILDLLQQRGLISSSHRAKSITFEDQGLERARQLLEKYGINIDV